MGWEKKRQQLCEIHHHRQFEIRVLLFSFECLIPFGALSLFYPKFRNFIHLGLPDLLVFFLYIYFFLFVSAIYYFRHRCPACAALLPWRYTDKCPACKMDFCRDMPDEEINLRFLVRKDLKKWISIPYFLFVGSLFFVGYLFGSDPDGMLLSKEKLLTLVLLFGCSMLGLLVFLWRCPRCDAYLGSETNIYNCPTCQCTLQPKPTQANSTNWLRKWIRRSKDD